MADAPFPPRAIPWTRKQWHAFHAAFRFWENGGYATAGALAGFAGVSERVARVVLERLANAGVIARVGYMPYRYEPRIVG